MNVILCIAFGCLIGGVIGSFVAGVNKRFEIMRNCINDMHLDVNDLQHEVNVFRQIIDKVDD